MLKLRGTMCIFKSASVPSEFRDKNSGVFGEKTINLGKLVISHQLKYDLFPKPPLKTQFTNLNYQFPPN